jgi:hypothetical protein
VEAVAGVALTLSGDVCWQYNGGWNKQNCTTMTADGDRVAGHGAVGKAVQVLTGPGRGQWRRIVSIGGNRNRTITLDFPFNPQPSTASSALQIGLMRGQIMIIGNDFVFGGAMQLYANCLDCVVAENTFRSFGFTNWGRNPHGIGLQTNLNNIMCDNRFPGGPNRGMAVAGAAPTCSGSYDEKDEERICSGDRGGPPFSPLSTPTSPKWIGCPGSATAKLGRDCAPFSDTGVGSYRGAMNLQLAWRRNTMSELSLTGVSGPIWKEAGSIPLVDGGVIEGNYDANGAQIELNAGGSNASAEGGWDSQVTNVLATQSQPMATSRLLVGGGAAPPAGVSTIVGGRLHVDGAPFFPLGMYTHALDDPDWAWMKASGQNTVLTYTNGLESEIHRASEVNLKAIGHFLDTAEAHGIKVFLSLKDFYDAHNKGADNEKIVTTIVTAFRGHRALLGYYVNDEYKTDYLPMLEKRARLLATLDPHHVLYSVEACYTAQLCNTTRLRAYRNTSTLFGTDPYPWLNSTLTLDIQKEAGEIDNLLVAWPGDDGVAYCTVFQIYSQGPFECAKNPSDCWDRTWPPYAVMRAMAFLQPVRGSGGLLQYAYYAQFGYPGKMLPRTDPGVAARLSVLAKLGLELRAFADREFLGTRTVLEVTGGLTSDGQATQWAALFHCDGCSTGGTLVVVNGNSKAVTVQVGGLAEKKSVMLKSWGVVTEKLENSALAGNLKSDDPATSRFKMDNVLESGRASSTDTFPLAVSQILHGPGGSAVNAAEKLGTAEFSMVETELSKTTPVVWQGRLLRFERVSVGPFSRPRWGGGPQHRKAGSFTVLREANAGHETCRDLPRVGPAFFEELVCARAAERNTAWEARSPDNIAAPLRTDDLGVDLAPFPRIASLWGAGLVGPGRADAAFWKSCGFRLPVPNASSAALWARYGLLAAFIADSPLPAALLAEWHEFLTEIKQLNPNVKFLATAPMMQMLTDFMTDDDETAPTTAQWFPRSCLLRTSKGETISWWKGTLFIPNLARRDCIMILLDHALTLSPLIKAGLVDGYFYDSVSDLLGEVNHLPPDAEVDVSLICTAVNCSGTPSSKTEMAAANTLWVQNQEWYFEQLRNLTGRQDLIVMANVSVCVWCVCVASALCACVCVVPCALCVSLRASS